MTAADNTQPTDADLLTQAQHLLGQALMRHPDTTAGRTAAWAELGWATGSDAERVAISDDVLADHRAFLLDTYLAGGLAALHGEAPLVEDIAGLAADLLTLIPDPDHALVDEAQDNMAGLARLTEALRRHPDTPEGRDQAWLEAGVEAESVAERDAISAELLAD